MHLHCSNSHCYILVHTNDETQSNQETNAGTAIFVANVSYSSQ